MQDEVKKEKTVTRRKRMKETWERRGAGGSGDKGEVRGIRKINK